MDERLRPWMLAWSHTSTPPAIKRMVEEAKKSTHAITLARSRSFQEVPVYGMLFQLYSGQKRGIGSLERKPAGHRSLHKHDDGLIW
jgi:hypothetical protein